MNLTRASLRALALLLGLVLACAAAVAGASPASAHASLIETTPFDGQELGASPDEVVLIFSEDVNAPTGGLRVFDNDGSRVDSGIQRAVTTDSVAVAVEEELDDGAYIATYRVVSEDGHVIRGAFVFFVGEGNTVNEGTLASVFAGGGDTALGIGAGVGRAATYLGVLLLVGAGLWLLVVARNEDDRDEADRVARRATWLALGATAVALPLQAMLSSGLGFGALTNTTLLSETVAGSVGIAAAVRVLGLAITFVPGRVATMGGGVVALLSFVVDGHTRTVEPAAVMVAGDIAHLGAGAAWLGGVVLLGLAIRRRRVDDDPVGAATVVARFSLVATWSLVVVTIAGSAMSWANVRALRTVTTTDYGWTLLVKTGIVAVIILVGIYNNRRLVPMVRRLVPTPAGGSTDTAGVKPTEQTPEPDPGDVAARGQNAGNDVRQRRRSPEPDPGDAYGRAAWTRLGGTVRFEAVAMVLVLAITAFLVNLRPAAEEAGITGAYDTYVEVTDDLSVNLVVDPNRAGKNEIHLYVFDETGRPLGSDDLEDLTIELSLPERDLGPLVRTPYVAGPGHWQLDGSDLALAGVWELDVILDVDRFTIERAIIEVVVNP